MLGNGIRHCRSPFGLTTDRMLNPPFLVFTVPSLFSSFSTLGEAAPVQLMYFLCAMMGLVGAALSISTMYPNHKPATEEVTDQQRLIPQKREA
jgi:hypothetical protein